MTCNICGNNSRSYSLCKKCKDTLYFENIFSVIKMISDKAKGNGSVIRYLSNLNRGVTMGAKSVWTKLYSKEAIKNLKERDFIEKKSAPNQYFQKDALVTLDHYRSVTSILNELVYLYDEGAIKNSKDVEETLDKLVIVICVTKTENSKLVDVQNKKSRGFPEYDDYVKPLNGDLVHYDESIITPEEKKLFFA